MCKNDHYKLIKKQFPHYSIEQKKNVELIINISNEAKILCYF